MDGRLNRPVLREAQIDEGSRTSSHDLASYVPRLLARRLATGGPIEQFEATTLRAALLLTDIAGFTAYVERVSNSRRTGIEDLARAFDGYFADLVGIVYGHGGDVLAIAGDAFFSYWPVDDDRQLADAVMRATEAAHAIQAGLGDRDGVAGHDFQTRAGVGAGKLTIAFVGGVGDRWELMPVGTPIADVARAERHARPGTVAIAESAWLLIEDRCAGRRLDDGLYELTEVRRPIGPMPAASLVAPDPSDDLLSAFVPLPVRQRQSTAGTEWMQEIRRVTVVMASLSVAGSADGGVELAHLGVQAFQRVLARFEGAAKVLVDNKGVTLSGAFGLPPRAHADDARRAITAAETLRRELEDIGLSCTVGVATGRAFCGIFGSDLRREYTLHGEVVNLASRLMEASGGEILCCDATAQAAHESVGFEALEPVDAEGARRSGGGAPRLVDAQRRQRSRVADGRARGSSRRRSGHGSTTW